jgi:hypothetical protein
MGDSGEGQQDDQQRGARAEHGVDHDGLGKVGESTAYSGDGWLGAMLSGTWRCNAAFRFHGRGAAWERLDSKEIWEIMGDQGDIRVQLRPPDRRP